MLLKLLCCSLAVGLALGQDYQDFQSRPQQNRPQAADAKPTPIPILKQINRHNEDGSYTYGYEGADGSFKIETKLATGEVKGKYGYVDADGKVRVVEYGANKYGFQPSGEGITVAPPTLVDESTDKNGQLIDYDDEPQQQQQRPQPAQPKYRPQPKLNRPAAVAPQPQYHYEQQPQQPQYAPQPQQQQQFPGSDVVYSSRPRPASGPDSEYTPQQTFIPTPQVQEQEYESAIGRFAQRPQPQQQQQQPAYQAPRAGSQLAQFQQQFQQPQQPQQQQQQQQYAPQRPVQVQQGRSTSVLDQLAKDFALPQGGSPALHDITYTYY